MKTHDGLQKTLETLPVQFRSMTVDRSGNDAKCSLSSEYPVERWFGMEILDHSPGAIVQDRMANGLPMLFNHDSDQLIGRWRSVDLSGGKLRMMPQFGTSAAAKEKQADFEAGILTDTSIGYQTLEMKLERTDNNGLDWYRVTKWMPIEGSLCSVPADPTVGAGRTLDAREFPVTVHRTPTAGKAATKEARTMEPMNVAAEAASVPTELERQRSIRALCNSYGISMAEAEPMLNDPACTLADAKARVGDAMLKRAGARTQILTTESPTVSFSAREANAYSVRRAIMAAQDPRMSCFEREVSDDIARRTKQPLSPNSVLIPWETRGNTLNVTSAGQGKETIPTEMLPLIEYLRNRLTVLQAGAMQINGLVGNIAIPRNTTIGTASMAAETSAAAQTSAAFDQVTMQPHRATAYTQYTSEFLASTSLDGEAFVRSDLGSALAQVMDGLCFTSNGISPNPNKGLFVDSSVNTVTYDASDVSASVIECETAISQVNADSSACTYITTPKVRGLWKRQPWLNNSNGRGVWEVSNNLEGRVNGYRALATNQVPSNLGAGSPPTDHGVIFGDFSNLVIGIWGAVEIVTDPYTNAKEGIYNVTCRQLFDTCLRHPQAFAKMLIPIS